MNKVKHFFNTKFSIRILSLVLVYISHNTDYYQRVYKDKLIPISLKSQGLIRLTLG